MKDEKPLSTLRVQLDTVVRMSYRLTDPEGNLIEERTPENAYEYLQGRGQINGPVERAVEGKTAGFRAEITVTPRDAYGDYDPELVVEIPRENFPANAQVAVGMRFNTTGPKGQPLTVRVIESDHGVVTVDGNHPLAGLELVFELRVLDVRAATASELVTGRVGETGTTPPFPSESGDDGSGSSLH